MKKSKKRGKLGSANATFKKNVRGKKISKPKMNNQKNSRDMIKATANRVFCE